MVSTCRSAARRFPGRPGSPVISTICSYRMLHTIWCRSTYFLGFALAAFGSAELPVHQSGTQRSKVLLNPMHAALTMAVTASMMAQISSGRGSSFRGFEIATPNERISGVR
jgi:hypothetical protein